MSANPVCPAVRAAKDKQGISYAQLAEKVGKPEDQVINILSGSAPSQDSVRAVASALNISGPVPQDSKHGA